MRTKPFSLFPLAVFLLFAHAGQAQQGSSFLMKLMKTPANFAVDFGFTPLYGLPVGVEQDVLGSRSFNAAFMFRARLGNTGLSLHPGIGIGNDNYAWKGGKTLLLDAQMGKISLEALPNNSVEKIIKSKVATTYLDIPLELRWASGMGRKVFRFTAGGKIGVLLSSHVKNVSEIYGKEYTNKLKGDLYLEAWRYGIYGRLGYNWYNFFLHYGLSDIFQADRWANGQKTSLRPITFGISLVGF